MNAIQAPPASAPDGLTGLLDRRGFVAALTGFLSDRSRSARSATVLRLDIDRFSSINESFGVATGDEVLRQVADCVRDAVPNAAGAARIGDDEFALLVERVDPGTARLIADELLRAIQRRVRIPDLALSVTASIGACHAADGSVKSLDLLNAADLALREAKERGRNTCQFFKPQMAASCSERTQLEAALRKALDAGEFRLHYQPQIDLRTGEIVGAEALLRWADPDRGIVAPGAFISVAENAGLIGPIGAWVIREVCRQQARRFSRGRSVVPIAVNVSALQFHDPGFAEMISTELRLRALPGSLLSLEITESVLMRDADVVSSTMAQLAGQGVRLALDDFGTGFSSLAYLKRLPLNRLKIDRCFVSELPGSSHDAAIVRAVISLSEHLQVQVVAEGVETAAQAQFLRENGCHVAQGFLWGRPLPDRDFQLLLSDVPASPAPQVPRAEAVTPGSRTPRSQGRQGKS